ncbi:DUF2628 domain-containing protein [Bacillus alkalicellulosilyticus]|uniref:DUF2628 domain-containing protein n=1 Tax=Alkalihalobacterium alkalicellulosilyticum TaxID=1912214 RepID=UPI000997FC88|nr:DUF2628 domain-containing protein [Bacillus alkalicellulosilyticus]
MYCAQCGGKLVVDAKFCSGCGSQVGIKSGLSAAYVAKDVQVEDKESLFIGKNQSYYFTKWKNENSWNWVAFFFPIFWLGYRKMYSTVFLIIGLFLLLDIIMLIIYPTYPIQFDYFVGTITGVIIGSQGNRLYKNHMNKKILAIEDTNVPEESKRNQIKAAGGASVGGIFLAILIFILYLIVSGILYWDYY